MSQKWIVKTPHGDHTFPSKEGAWALAGPFGYEVIEPSAPPVATVAATTTPDPICVLDANNYCARHDEVHIGQRLTSSQDPGPVGQRRRRLWDKLLSGEAIDPMAIPPQFSVGVGGNGRAKLPKLLNRGCGWRLKVLLASWNIRPTPECPCNATMIEMNERGVAAVRADIDRYASLLQATSAKYGWKEWLTAGAKAVKEGVVSWNPIAHKLDPLLKWRQIVEHACKLAEEAGEAEPQGEPPPPETAFGTIQVGA